MEERGETREKGERNFDIYGADLEANI